VIERHPSLRETEDDDYFRKRYLGVLKSGKLVCRIIGGLARGSVIDGTSWCDGPGYPISRFPAPCALL